MQRRRAPLQGYVVKLDMGQGNVDIDEKFLEPVLLSRAEAETLLSKTLDNDHDEIQQPASSPSPEPEDYADDSPLSEEEALPRFGVPLRNGTRPGRLRPFDESPFRDDYADDSPLSGAESPPIPRPGQFRHRHRQLRSTIMSTTRNFQSCRIL